MTTHIALMPLVSGRLAGMRLKATPVRKQVELALCDGETVELDFAGVDATQSFVDELVGLLVLERGPEVVQQLRFKNCTSELQAIVRFVISDRAEQFECQAH
jgi:hypothetical protein